LSRYRYGFNGKENDNEVKGEGNQQDYGFRIYDPRVGRFLSVDPLASSYPELTLYQFAGNRPIRLIDIDGLAPGDPVKPYDYGPPRSIWREGGFFLRHHGIGKRIGSVEHNSTNISTNSARFAINTELRENFAAAGSHINAYRHVLWQATITNRFESKTAMEVGNAHEEVPNLDLTQRNFLSVEGADQTIDLLNNQIGRQIGINNPNASMKELAIQVLDEFKENGLYTIVRQKDGTYKKDGKYEIDKTRLTDEEYNRALHIISRTNDNGYTPEQQEKRNKEIAVEKQRKQDKNDLTGINKR
jgi:RHS repeat-associated protein